MKSLDPATLRKEKKIPQVMVAEGMGITQGAISKLEKKPFAKWSIEEADKYLELIFEPHHVLLGGSNLDEWLQLFLHQKEMAELRDSLGES